MSDSETSDKATVFVELGIRTDWTFVISYIDCMKVHVAYAQIWDFICLIFKYISTSLNITIIIPI